MTYRYNKVVVVVTAAAVLRHSVLFTYPFLALRRLSPHSIIACPHIFLFLS
jgi:hypothetical protein